MFNTLPVAIVKAGFIHNKSNVGLGDRLRPVNRPGGIVEESMQVDFTLAHLFKRVVVGVVVGIDGCGQTVQEPLHCGRHLGRGQRLIMHGMRLTNITTADNLHRLGAVSVSAAGNVADKLRHDSLGLTTAQHVVA